MLISFVRRLRVDKVLTFGMWDHSPRILERTELCSYPKKSSFRWSIALSWIAKCGSKIYYALNTPKTNVASLLFAILGFKSLSVKSVDWIGGGVSCGRLRRHLLSLSHEKPFVLHSLDCHLTDCSSLGVFSVLWAESRFNWRGGGGKKYPFSMTKLDFVGRWYWM